LAAPKRLPPLNGGAPFAGSEGSNQTTPEAVKPPVIRSFPVYAGRPRKTGKPLKEIPFWQTIKFFACAKNAGSLGQDMAGNLACRRGEANFPAYPPSRPKPCGPDPDGSFKFCGLLA
jgi:hypothetical protein